MTAALRAPEPQRRLALDLGQPLHGATDVPHARLVQDFQVRLRSIPSEFDDGLPRPSVSDQATHDLPFAIPEQVAVIWNALDAHVTIRPRRTRSYSPSCSGSSPRRRPIFGSAKIFSWTRIKPGSARRLTGSQTWASLLRLLFRGLSRNLSGHTVASPLGIRSMGIVGVPCERLSRTEPQDLRLAAP